MDIQEHAAPYVFDAVPVNAVQAVASAVRHQWGETGYRMASAGSFTCKTGGISEWGRDGWAFHTLLPTVDWYAHAPSYTRKDLDPDHEQVFYDIGARLLERYSLAMFKTSAIDCGEDL